ncbi:hypothetical protein CVT26_008925 [Gymnopilus dilepis]|uniref:Uncharacterized protein n=1 Tax=Gymnopilus dilepis TaxID=231916 RepID=A0A409YRP2_9AGAR|nr:hypothetical protein CVT26_008925 [Gymnopilus dilepis]
MGGQALFVSDIARPSAALRGGSVSDFSQDNRGSSSGGVLKLGDTRLPCPNMDDLRLTSFLLFSHLAAGGLSFLVEYELPQSSSLLVSDSEIRHSFSQVMGSAAL